MERGPLKTMIGVILIKLATGVVTCWGTINLYILSYFHQLGEQINQSTNSILLLAIILPISVFILFAPKLVEMFGAERVTRTCSIIFFISPLLINLKFTILNLVIFCMIVPTTAFAISMVPIFYCLWTQFPVSKNKATSLAVVCFGLGGIIWNYLFMMLVNPNNEKATIYEDSTHMIFFDEKVTKNVLSALRVGYLISGATFVIGSFLVQQNKEYKEEKINTQIQLRQYSPPQILQDFKQQRVPQRLPQEPTLKQTLLSPKFIVIFMISFLSGVFQIYINTNVKLIYMSIVDDDHFLAYSTMVGVFVSTFGAFIWGYLGDHKGFSLALLIFAIMDCAVKLFGCFAKTKVTIMIMFILLGITDKGMLTLMGPGLVSLFGIKMATQLLPYKGISIYLGFGFAPLMYLVLSGLMSPHQYLSFLWIFSLAVIIMAFRFYQNKIK